MDQGILSMVAQFGAAGLIGMLWLHERRSGAQRERQLDEAHRAVRDMAKQRDSLLTVIQENTRALSALERSQQRLIDVLERLWWRRGDERGKRCR